MKLPKAISLMEKHAVGRDAWFIKVSGTITMFPNTLIPSTIDGLTHANYHSRRAKQRAQSQRSGFMFDEYHEQPAYTGNTAIFTDIIESGVIAWATWLMIRAMPDEMRADYENLEVESIVFYPAKMVAKTGPEYDELVNKFDQTEVPWSSTLEPAQFEQTIRRKFDRDNIALAFDIGQLARTLIEARRTEQEKTGRGSATDLALKQPANTIWGVSASPFHVTQNVIFANVITATARAVAWAMVMSLNGYQVITDGCIYRDDQIPALTFRQCIARAHKLHH